MSILRDNGQI